MHDDVTVTLSGRALELARAMVDSGTCDTLGQAVGRLLGIAFLHDSQQERDLAAWSGPMHELEADLASLDAEVAAGKCGVAAPELWAEVRRRVLEGSRSGAA